uniref:Uncharacterized protein n=1 Tax=Panagrolaimus sp. ES5 TaxID=591445 RepID=A0AC34F7I6_9BILA
MQTYRKAYCTKRCFLFFGWILEETDEYAEPLEHLLLTCHCTNSTEDYFYFSASLKINDTVSNGIAVCVRAHKLVSSIYSESGYVQYFKRIPGVNSTRDLYDLLAYKYLTIYRPSTLLLNNMTDDMSNGSSSGCLDVYGMPTRKFDGVQSCLVQYLFDSTKGKNYVFNYSGPLLYGNLEWIPDDFLNTTSTFVHYKINNATLPGYCKNDTRNGAFYAYTCVCHGDGQEKCRKPVKKRICAYDIEDGTKNVSAMQSDKLFLDKCEYFFIECDAYGANQWCSMIGIRQVFVEGYKACCDENDFCNAMNVISQKNTTQYLTDFECIYAGKMIAMLSKYCERYLDLMLNETVVLNSYVYHELKNNPEYEKFKEEVSRSDDYWLDSFGALCFIELSFVNKVYHINANAITDNKTIPPACSEFPFSPNSNIISSSGKISCCTAILQQPQSESNCTIEFMLNEFHQQMKKEDIVKQLTGQKGTLKCGKHDCLISDGCYETKEITNLPDDEEEEFTSSFKCVSNIEKNMISSTITEPSTATPSTISNFEEYGFVCRTLEAKDRCTVVYPHDSTSKPLIVCCCNDGYKILSESDGTFKCPTKLEKLPSKIGKNIGSFNNH